MGRPISSQCSHTRSRANQLTPVRVSIKCSYAASDLNFELHALYIFTALTVQNVRFQLKTCAIVRHAKTRPPTQKNHHPRAFGSKPQNNLPAFHPQSLRFRSPERCTIHIVGEIYPKIDMPWPDGLLLASRDGKADLPPCSYTQDRAMHTRIGTMVHL